MIATNAFVLAVVVAGATATQPSETLTPSTPPKPVPVNLNAPPDRSAPPALQPVKPFTIQQPQEWKLKNGMRVLLLERKRAPLVDVAVSIDAGNLWDTLATAGLAKWTADMLTEGSGDMDSIAFSDAENAIGASIGSSADDDDASADLHVTSSKLPEGMKLFAQMLLKPRFDDKEWSRTEKQLIGELVDISQDPQQLARLAGARAQWGKDHRYGVNAGGTPAALVKTTPADLKAFYAAHYRPDNTTFVVVGDVDKKTLTKLLDDNFGAWTATGAAPAAPKWSGPVSVDKRTVLTVNVPGAPQTVLRVLNVVPGDVKPYTPDVEVMNTLLGGSFTSRLNSNLREEHGYSYGAGSRVTITKSGNYFGVRTSVATPVTGPATKEIIGELERIRESVSADEDDRARNLAALSVPSAFDNGRTTASVWAGIVALGTDPKRLQAFMADAPKVDVKAILGAAAKVVDANKCTIVAVGDIDKVGKDLDSFGPRSSTTAEELLPGLKEAMAALGGEEGGGG